MSRYIDADALINDLSVLFVHNGNLKDEWLSYCVEKIIHEQPTADVVEVVRCKECRWYKNEFDWQGNEYIGCTKEVMQFIREPTDFCSYGERREHEKI